MNVFSLVERVLMRLSALPGLGFLHNYVREFYSRRAGIYGRVGRYQSYVSTVRGAGAEVAQAAGVSKKNSESSDDDEEASGDDFEETYDDESYMQ